MNLPPNEYNYAAAIYLTPIETGAFYDQRSTCLLIQIVTNLSCLLTTGWNSLSLEDFIMKLLFFKQMMFEVLLKLYSSFFIVVSGPIHNKLVLLDQIIAWHWVSGKPSSQPYGISIVLQCCILALISLFGPPNITFQSTLHHFSVLVPFWSHGLTCLWYDM